LIEDEESLAIGLKYNLEEEGYNVTHADDGKKAMDFFLSGDFDLIILDIMLPYYDGFEVAKFIREKSPRIPILFLTAKTQINDKIKGFEIGADDYVTKPFHLTELLLRVEGMLKRKEWYGEDFDSASVFHLGDNLINFNDLSCKCQQGDIRLTHHEALLLKYFISNKGKVITRKELLEKVWGIESEIETRTVDNFIARLRKYFEKNPSHPIYFISVRNQGYMYQNQNE